MATGNKRRAAAGALALVFRTTVEDLYCLAENKEQEDRENEEWT